ncbi:hypothetical protein ACEPAI_3086 [Sanghuangporus weigelae]
MLYDRADARREAFQSASRGELGRPTGCGSHYKGEARRREHTSGVLPIPAPVKMAQHIRLYMPTCLHHTPKCTKPGRLISGFGFDSYLLCLSLNDRGTLRKHLPIEVETLTTLCRSGHEIISNERFRSKFEFITESSR